MLIARSLARSTMPSFFDQPLLGYRSLNFNYKANNGNWASTPHAGADLRRDFPVLRVYDTRQLKIAAMTTPEDSLQTEDWP